MRLIDSYVHVGVEKYRPVQDLVTTMDHVGVQRSVLCQYLGMEDNEYLRQCVLESPSRFIACALIDPAGAGWRRKIQDIARSSAFRGLRMTVEMATKSPDAANLALELGLNLVLYRNTIELPTALATRRIEAPGNIVVSHLGTAVTTTGSLSDDILELAEDGRVNLGISGASLFERFPYAEFGQLVRSVVSRFGEDRLMWGSNFPASAATVAEYQADLNLLSSWGLDDDALAAVTRDNALRLWFNMEVET